MEEQKTKRRAPQRYHVPYTTDTGVDIRVYDTKEELLAAIESGEVTNSEGIYYGHLKRMKITQDVREAD